MSSRDTRKFTHLTCRQILLKLSSAILLQEMVILHLLAHKAPASATKLLFSTFPLSLRDFLAIFVSNTVSFLANMILLSLDAFFTPQTQFLISSDIYGPNPCWIPEESSANLQLKQKMSIFFLVSCLLHSSCHTSLIKKKKKKWKPNNMIGLNRLLSCVATLQAVLYLSDESIRSQVNHQSLKK